MCVLFRTDYTEAMKNVAFVLIFISSYALSQEPIEIIVGMYPFAPFVELSDSGAATGMTVDLVIALNKSQTKYSFQTILVPPKRRYQSYIRGDFDVIFYENKAWSWQNHPMDISQIYQKGGEVYVALKQFGRGQEYFDNFENKRMMGIIGFHYGFADFKTDEKYLRTKFNISLSLSNDENLTKLLKQRGDVAVITKAYLQRYFKKHPKVEDRLLISEQLDQEYNHTALLRPDSKISIAEINEMLDGLASSGEMQRLFERYGISQH